MSDSTALFPLAKQHLLPTTLRNLTMKRNIFRTVGGTHPSGSDDFAAQGKIGRILLFKVKHASRDDDFFTFLSTLLSVREESCLALWWKVVIRGIHTVFLNFFGASNHWFSRAVRQRLRSDVLIEMRGKPSILGESIDR